MIFCLLLGAILWAGTAAIPESVKNYFRAQVAYTVLIWPAALLFGDKSITYTVVFSVATWMILFYSAGIVMDFLAGNSLKWFAVACGLLCGMSLTLIAVANLGRPLQIYDYVGFFEAGMLISYGAALGITTRFVSKRKRMIALTLAILWMVLAGYDYGFYLNYGHPAWERQNWFTPAYLLIAGFSWLGWKLRQREYVLNI